MITSFGSDETRSAFPVESFTYNTTAQTHANVSLLAVVYRVIIFIFKSDFRVVRTARQDSNLEDEPVSWT